MSSSVGLLVSNNESYEKQCEILTLNFFRGGQQQDPIGVSTKQSCRWNRPNGNCHDTYLDHERVLWGGLCIGNLVLLSCAILEGDVPVQKLLFSPSRDLRDVVTC